MVGLVSKHAPQSVAEGRVVGQAPVGDGDLRGGQVEPGVVQLGTGGLHLLDDGGVCVTGGLLQISHESVHRGGVERVQDHQYGCHGHLCSDHKGPREERCVEHLQTDQQMHALVLSFFKECHNPAVVTLERTQGVEVPEPSRHESRHSREGLQHDQAPLDARHRRSPLLVPGQCIEGVVQAVHRRVHDLVPDGDRLVPVERVEAVVDLLLTPDVVLLSAEVICVLPVRLVSFAVRLVRILKLTVVLALVVLMHLGYLHARNLPGSESRDGAQGRQMQAAGDSHGVQGWRPHTAGEGLEQTSAVFQVITHTLSVLKL
mmetsp:Transcript_7047/g.15411  ORF Transcript_7047/g.15411 Transcript_7047/m.15411 type:complete len:316 (-) Transcript_7047:49-996(-)